LAAFVFGGSCRSSLWKGDFDELEIANLAGPRDSHAFMSFRSNRLSHIASD
jgi:hypothetical protein